MVPEPKSMLPPPDWAEDKLSEYFQLAIANLLGTFALKIKGNKPFVLLRDVDKQYCVAAEALEKGCSDRLLEAQLLLRAHSSFRGASIFCCMTMIPESFPVLRSCIEYSLYALHMHKNPSQIKIWSRRHESKSERDLSINSFSHSKVMKALRVANEALADVTETHYDKLIDLGAHPNPVAIRLGRELRQIEGGRILGQKYLTEDPKVIMLGIAETAVVGLISLSIFAEIFSERFKLVGVHEYLTKNKKLIRK